MIICVNVIQVENKIIYKTIVVRPKINHQIKARELILIDEEGNKVGLVTLEEALKMAGEKGLDLIEVNPVAKPPIVKIIEYGKFSYEQRKKEKKARVQQKAQSLKQVRIKFKTSDNDQRTKARQVEKFLVKGNKVRVEIFLRGREKAHRDLAEKKLKGFLEIISEEYRVLEEVRNTPRGLTATIMQ